MARTKDEAARELAEWHFGVEPDLKQVIRIVADDQDAPGEPRRRDKPAVRPGSRGAARAARGVSDDDACVALPSEDLLVGRIA